MTPFKNQLQVDIHDVDFNGIAKTSALMRYIQSAAQLQLAENGKSYDNLKNEHRAFILSKIKMEFTDALRAYEPITVTTFPCDSKGYSFLRCYTIEKFDETVGRAVSVWALVDTDTHSLIRVNDFDLGLTTYSPLDLSIDRMVMPSIMETVGHYTVEYGIIDQNRHMNNTAYPDMYSNFLPLDGKRIESITISFKNEAPAKDKLTVERAIVDDTYYFRTIRTDGKINTEAEIRLTDVK